MLGLVILTVVGAVLYLAPLNPKLVEIGRTMMAHAFLALVLVLAWRTVH